MRLNLLIILATCSIVFGSCLKENDTYNEEDIVSALSVVHGSPDTPPVEFILDGQRINYQSFEYGNRIKYFGVYSGSWPVAFYLPQTAAASPLYRNQIQLLNGKFYTLFLAGTKDNLDGILIEDNVEAPEDGKAKIRFINLGADAGTVDFVLGDQTLASKKKFKEYTRFQSVAPGEYAAAIISESGDVNHAFTLRIKPNEIYTVWLKGLVHTDKETQGIDEAVINHSEELEN